MYMGVKISDLPAISIPYNGGEKIPLVQSGVTKASNLSSFVNYLSGALLADSELKSLSGVWQSNFTTTNANSANWNNVYSTVLSLSTSWEESADILPTVTNYLSTNNVILSSATIANRLRVNNDVLIFGNLSASGTSTFANTIFSTTTAISVIHIGSGTALWVGNNGTGDIASFYDIDQNVEVLHVAGANGSNPGVGIQTSTPNKTLTVNGEISANSIIWDPTGNSINWNSAYSTVQSNSATTWNYQGTDLKSLSSGWIGGNIAYTNLISNSAAYLSAVDLSFLSVSGNWNNAYTTVASNSANWSGGTSLSGVINHGVISYVSLSGNNTTAQVSRPDLPYATPQAALQALFEIRFIELAPYYDVNGDEIDTPPPPSSKLLFIGVGEFGGIDLDAVDTTNCPSNNPNKDLLYNGISIAGYNPCTCRLGGITASFEIGLRGDRSVNLGDVNTFSVGFVNIIARDITCSNIMNLVQITAQNLVATNNIHLQSGNIVSSATSLSGSVIGGLSSLNYIGQYWFYEG